MSELFFAKQGFRGPSSGPGACLLTEEVRDSVLQILQYLGYFLQIELPRIPLLLMQLVLGASYKSKKLLLGDTVPEFTSGKMLIAVWLVGVVHSSMDLKIIISQVICLQVHFVYIPNSPDLSHLCLLSLLFLLCLYILLPSSVYLFSKYLQGGFLFQIMLRHKDYGVLSLKISSEAENHIHERTVMINVFEGIFLHHASCTLWTHTQKNP